QGGPVAVLGGQDDQGKLPQIAEWVEKEMSWLILALLLSGFTIMAGFAIMAVRLFDRWTGKVISSFSLDDDDVEA
ncbi:MAG TPA: hypothetical protein VLN41_00075, partial [Candidatus Bathyarchaeia archaeon]|nr:hypothetical protein [Candidatus Bathyarchaeia archaeon]